MGMNAETIRKRINAAVIEAYLNDPRPRLMGEIADATGFNRASITKHIGHCPDVEKISVQRPVGDDARYRYFDAYVPKREVLIARIRALEQELEVYKTAVGIVNERMDRLSKELAPYYDNNGATSRS